MIAKELMHIVHHLGCGDPAHGIARQKLDGNPYWPDDWPRLPARSPHERYVLLLPWPSRKTQDDKGRVRWTLFGGSEQGPARPFGRAFIPPRGGKCRGSGPKASSAACWPRPTTRSRKPWPIFARRAFAFTPIRPPRSCPLLERRAAAQMDRALSLGKGLAPRRPLPVDLLPLEVPARGGAAGPIWPAS